MTAPRFSIAMATYNGERFLKDQLESLARQTLLPFELIVCDDGSTDKTLSILEAFAERSPFEVRICQNERNLGYGDTFLKSASLCKGDWIAFCDQDDVWLHHKLARCAGVVVEHPEVYLLSHSADQVDAHLRALPYRIPDHRSFSITGPLQNTPLAVLSGFTCCVRRDLLKQASIHERPKHMRKPGDKQPHDSFVYHLANTYGHIARLPESLVLYRRHHMTVTGLTGTGLHNRKQFLDRLKALPSGRDTELRQKADHARQHQVYYQRTLDRAQRDCADSLFVTRTCDAITYYGEVAAAFETRAAIYRPGTDLAARVRAFLRGLRQGAYGDFSTGRGFGRKAMAKDLARLVASDR